MKIGILGGGQLSRMLALAGIPLGLDFAFYEPNLGCSAENLGQVFHSSYTDRSMLEKFAQSVDVISYENENIPPETLEYLSSFKPLHPQISAIQIGQDRLLEKQMFLELGVPTTKFRAVNSAADLAAAVAELGYPVFWKTRRFGYDGKGQLKISSPTELAQVMQEANLDLPALVEGQINFTREVSQLAVRNRQGEVLFYDLCENQHQQGILRRSYNRPQDPIAGLAQKYLAKILLKLNYVGVLAVEFFQVGTELIANEMAPRVHNSGHWTIEGACSSQFENHLRAVADLPLGSTHSLGSAVMYNIISQFPDKTALLQLPGVHVHDYQKSAALGRKLGHVTVLDPTSMLTRQLEQVLGQV